MTKNLLTKTLRWYIVFAIIILLVTAPVFYFVTRHLYIEEANETLRLHKKEFLYYHLPNITIQGIDHWNGLHRDEKIIPVKRKHRKDKFSTIFYYDTLSHEREPYRVIMSPVTVEGQPYTFVAKINLVEREDLMKSIAVLFLGLIVIMLIGLYFITRIMSVRLWRPFYHALDQLEKFQIDKSTKTDLSTTSINEFIRLNQAVDSLIRKNTSIYNAQKEFIENAAHELQTPLAVVQGKIEALFQQSGLSQVQAEILEKLNDSVSRLTRLNKNLLLLSRIDHDHFSASEDISINDLLNRHLDFFYEQAAAKNIKIQMNTQHPLIIRGNSTLTEVLLNNLFLNAIRHNHTDGIISVIIKEKELLIANTGASSPLPKEKIFDRFSKINPSTQGSGLGLAIVKKIADHSMWRIRYSFQDSLHTFSVEFP